MEPSQCVLRGKTRSSGHLYQVQIYRVFTKPKCVEGHDGIIRNETSALYSTFTGSGSILNKGLILTVKHALEPPATIPYVLRRRKIEFVVVPQMFQLQKTLDEITKNGKRTEKILRHDNLDVAIIVLRDVLELNNGISRPIRLSMERPDDDDDYLFSGWGFFTWNKYLKEITMKTRQNSTTNKQDVYHWTEAQLNAVGKQRWTSVGPADSGGPLRGSGNFKDVQYGILKAYAKWYHPFESPYFIRITYIRNWIFAQINANNIYGTVRMGHPKRNIWNYNFQQK